MKTQYIHIELKYTEDDQLLASSAQSVSTALEALVAEYVKTGMRPDQAKRFIGSILKSV